MEKQREDERFLYFGRVVKIQVPRIEEDPDVCYTPEMITAMNGKVARVIGCHHDEDGRLWFHLEGEEYMQENGHGWFPFKADWLRVLGDWS